MESLQSYDLKNCKAKSAIHPFLHAQIPVVQVILVLESLQSNLHIEKQGPISHPALSACTDDSSVGKTLGWNPWNRNST